jgi:hypothetical protein
MDDLIIGGSKSNRFRRVSMLPSLEKLSIRKIWKSMCEERRREWTHSMVSWSPFQLMIMTGMVILLEFSGPR